MVELAHGPCARMTRTIREGSIFIPFTLMLPPCGSRVGVPRGGSRHRPEGYCFMVELAWPLHGPAQGCPKDVGVLRLFVERWMTHADSPSSPLLSALVASSSL